MSKFAKVCTDCGAEFVARFDYIEKCRKCRYKNGRQAYKRKERPTEKVKIPHVSLTETLKELDAYNRSHNTSLTYGQYVMMREGRK